MSASADRAAERPSPSRARRIGLWVLATIIGFVALAALALLVLLHTGVGRDFALGRLDAALDGGLEYSAVRGTLSSGLAFDDFAVTTAETSVRADHIELEFEPLALLRKKLNIQRFEGRGVRVELAESTVDPDAPVFALPDLKLPVDVTIDAAELADVTIRRGGEPLLVIERGRFRGTLDQQGRLALRDVDIASDAGALRGEIDLVLDGGQTVGGDFYYAMANGEPIRSRVTPGADGGRSIELWLPGSATPDVRLDIGASDDWALTVAVDQFQPRQLDPSFGDQPVSVSLTGTGNGWIGALSGDATIGDQHITIASSNVALIDRATAFRFDPLILSLADGSEFQATGTLGLTAGLPVDMQVAIADVPIAAEPPTQLAGSLSLVGPLDQWRYDFTGQIVRGELVAPVAASGTGSLEAVNFETFSIRHGGGELLGSGRLQLDPAPSFEIAATMRSFDPSLLVEGLDGAVDAKLAAQGSFAPQLKLDLDIESLGGTLHGKPLSGGGRVVLGQPGASALDVRIGDSRAIVEGQIADVIDLDVELERVVLADWLAGAAGTLDGSLKLSGDASAPAARGELVGADIAVAGFAAKSMTIDFDWPGAAAAATAPARARLVAKGASFAGTDFETFQAELDGSRSSHRFSLVGRGAERSISAGGLGSLDGNGDWRGELQQLALDGERWGQWRLEAPTVVSIGSGALTLEQTCLIDAPVRVCAALTQGRDEALNLEATIAALPIDRVAALAGLDPSIQFRGDIQGRIEARLDGPATTAMFSIESPSGSAAMAPAQTGRDRVLLAWNALKLDGTIESRQLEASLAGAFTDGGQITGRLSGASPFAEPNGTVDGHVAVDLPDLAFLELISEEIAAAQGHVDGDLNIAGTWQKLRLSGAIVATDIAAVLPGLGLKLQDSRIALVPDDAGLVGVEARFNTGKGVLSVDGRINNSGDAIAAEFDVSGKEVLVADTALLRAVASPNLALKWQDGKLSVRGDLLIPEARLSLAEIEDRLTPSPDVVVTDPARERSQASELPLSARVAVTLGDDVKLEGLGFDGKISGKLDVRERPGRATIAGGRLDVTGKYKAYGQDLEITRGRLLYSNSPIDDPTLDIRAVRELRGQDVGVEVTGTALVPQLELWSDPRIDQADAMSWLVFGRPIASASADEAAVLNQAAVSAGANFLAKRVGDRTGLDTFGVSYSSALGSSAFTVGKYLSPKLYVSYGVSLFGAGEILSFQYILTKRWEVEIEAGTENRVGFNYRLER